MKVTAEKPQDVQVVRDTGWQHNTRTSIPHRGINDYDREIQFAATLTDAQLTAWCRWLESDNCPGWTGVRGIPVSSGAYRFHTTYDSSD